MLEWIVKYWVEELFAVVIALLSFAVKRLSDKLKKEKQYELAEREAILSLLDDAMGELYSRCRERGYVTREELRRYERMYSAYRGLGGNGAVSVEHEQFISLKVYEG